MFNLARASHTIVDWKDDRYGPLPALLLVLTMVTGVVDAVSYLKLGHVFVANMTGNVVFLGFAIADPQNFSLPASLAAIGAFFAGALAGGRLSLLFGRHRGRHIMFAIVTETALVGVTLIASTSANDPDGTAISYALIVLLALTMGLQNATARRIGVPDLTTTVLTLTITGLAADSSFSGANNPQLWRRLAAIASMFLGAALGAIFVSHFGVSAALALVLVTLVSAGVTAYRHSASSAAWAVGVG
jgi:uncharacterized membrane protein YoaK (UPF0700 family)